MATNTDQISYTQSEQQPPQYGAFSQEKKDMRDEHRNKRTASQHSPQGGWKNEPRWEKGGEMKSSVHNRTLYVSGISPEESDEFIYSEIFRIFEEYCTVLSVTLRISKSQKYMYAFVIIQEQEKMKTVIDKCDGMQLGRRRIIVEKKKYNDPPQNNYNSLTCYRCGRGGHIARYCHEQNDRDRVEMEQRGYRSTSRHQNEYASKPRERQNPSQRKERKRENSIDQEQRRRVKKNNKKHEKNYSRSRGKNKKTDRKKKKRHYSDSESYSSSSSDSSSSDSSASQFDRRRGRERRRNNKRTDKRKERKRRHSRSPNN